nr:cation-dependent mannose-6-phosphate receptor [Ciona intestinalis]|eukprot:XP_018670708.2 cation-dependent mannose-6-phosphate receptor [Ciona intestinalis]
MLKPLLLSLFMVLHTQAEQLAKNDCTLLKQNQQSQELLKRLDPLKGKIFTYKFKDEINGGDEYDYTLSICSGVTANQFNAPGVGVLQYNKLKQEYKRVGLINSTVVKGGTDWIMLTYKHGDRYHSHCTSPGSELSRRQAHIMIVCDPNELEGQFKVLYEHNDEDTESSCFYMMEISSRAACSHVNGLSTGSILLIIFVSVTSAYLLIGVVYKRCVYGSKGFEQIPNIVFWRMCGNLQADGCDLLCRTRGSGYIDSKPYQGVADDQLDDEIDDEHLLPM